MVQAVDSGLEKQVLNIVVTTDLVEGGIHDEVRDHFSLLAVIQRFLCQSVFFFELGMGLQ